MKYWDKVKVKQWFYEWLEWILVGDLNDKYQVRLFWNEEYIYEKFTEDDLLLIK